MVREKVRSLPVGLIRASVACTWGSVDAGLLAMESRGMSCHLRKLNRDCSPPPRRTTSPHAPMSVNQRGRIVGQVVRPGLAAPDRKQKRLPTPHPHPPAPAQEFIIEISSDEDEEFRPPSKRALTKRGHPPPTHEPDYKARLSKKDREIEKLKKVRHR